MAESSFRGIETVIRCEKVSRPEAIARLRECLRTFADQDRCVCKAVGKLSIFCKGFKRLSDEQFRARFDWIARRQPGMPRERLEELANLYHAGRQEATGTEICCDVETREHVACDGWNEFDNERLAEFHLALTGNPVRIA